MTLPSLSGVMEEKKLFSPYDDTSEEHSRRMAASFKV
jgi:hypothetical protein